MAIISHVVYGIFESNEVFTFAEHRVSVDVIKSDHQVRSPELDPSYLCIGACDMLKKPLQREWVIVHRNHTRLIKCSQRILFSPENLQAALNHLNLRKGIDLSLHFSAEDGLKIARFVHDNLPFWQSQQSQWIQGVGFEYRWFKAREIGKEILPRTLLVCRVNQTVTQIFVFFNQKFPKGDPKGKYEGALGEGTDNRIKCVLELFTGMFLAARISKYGDAQKRAIIEEQIIENLPADCVVKSVMKVVYQGATREKFMTMKPIFFSDLFRMISAAFDKRFDIALRVISKLDRVHKLGVAHGDFKLDAVMFNENFQQLRLVDLGRAMPVKYPPPIQRMGTPGYLYPFSVEIETPLTDDRWGLGIVLWAIFDVHFTCTDGSQLDYVSHFEDMTSICPLYFFQTFDNYKCDYAGYLKAVGEKVRQRWIVEPPPNTLEHVIWSLLRSDILPQDEEALLETQILPALQALKPRPNGVLALPAPERKGEGPKSNGVHAHPAPDQGGEAPPSKRSRVDRH